VAIPGHTQDEQAEVVSRKERRCTLELREKQRHKEKRLSLKDQVSEMKGIFLRYPKVVYPRFLTVVQYSGPISKRNTVLGFYKFPSCSLKTASRELA